MLPSQIPKIRDLIRVPHMCLTSVLTQLTAGTTIYYILLFSLNISFNKMSAPQVSDWSLIVCMIPVHNFKLGLLKILKRCKWRKKWHDQGKKGRKAKWERSVSHGLCFAWLFIKLNLKLWKIFKAHNLLNISRLHFIMNYELLGRIHFIF